MSTRPTIGVLTLVCPATGGEISTGVVYHDADLARARAARLLLHCRHCGTIHLFDFAHARLAPLGARQDDAPLFPDGGDVLEEDGAA